MSDGESPSSPEDSSGTEHPVAPETAASDLRYLAEAVVLAAAAKEAGDHPFGALVTDSTGAIVATARNRVVTDSDPTAHAETVLIRAIGATHDAQARADLTLYASMEPCAMCAGAIYWSGISTVVFALSEEELRAAPGTDSKNPSLALPCREVFSHGVREMSVRGPYDLESARTVVAGF